MPRNPLEPGVYIEAWTSVKYTDPHFPQKAGWLTLLTAAATLWALVVTRGLIIRLLFHLLLGFATDQAYGTVSVLVFMRPVIFNCHVGDAEPDRSGLRIRSEERRVGKECR